MEPSNNLVLIQSPVAATSSDPNTKTYSNLAAGFYGVSFGYDPSGLAGSTFYQSNTYDCPSTQAYTGKRGVFLPCLGQAVAHAEKVNLHQQ